ncbi:MAG: diguanylate cyclase [Epsilonproteobacteria bacterium]|nr:diguanylate cyclase [Campylobacterota bacterium]
MSRKWRLSLAFAAAAISLLGLYWYLGYLGSSSEDLKLQTYKAQALSMKQRAESMILNKQKSTMAMALAIANDKSFVKDVADRHITDGYFAQLIALVRDNTLYKNIWIQVVDEELTSLYRSWSNKRGDNLYTLRDDLREVIEKNRVSCSISSGNFDLSIKAMVPVVYNERVVGAVEVISHFNSITKQLAESNIHSVVVLSKERSYRLKYPFTNIFLGDYYVANLDARYESLNYLKQYGLENYMNDGYKIENNYVISTLQLDDNEGRPLAYFIMFKLLNEITVGELDFFIFRSFTYGFAAFIIVLVLLGIVVFVSNRKQKLYYKNIIDSSTNMVVINDKVTILGVNKAFFRYFSDFRSLEAFKDKHKCICEFFIEEDGYLKKDMNGVKWVDYLIENQTKSHKVKLAIGTQEYYFSISASLVSQDLGHYGIVFTDITEQERYRRELESLSTTDHLTGIGNRRYFTTKANGEIARAERYKTPLSFIMFDIDHFKLINDKHGHDVGDMVLVEYTRLIASVLRESDIFCRVGGEEFVIILPHTRQEQALELAHKLREIVESHHKILNVTMSFGVAMLLPNEKLEMLYRRLDTLLYRAKNSGRNRVVSS